MIWQNIAYMTVVDCATLVTWRLRVNSRNFKILKIFTMTILNYLNAKEWSIKKEINSTVNPNETKINRNLPPLLCLVCPFRVSSPTPQLSTSVTSLWSGCATSVYRGSSTLIMWARWGGRCYTPVRSTINCLENVLARISPFMLIMWPNNLSPAIKVSRKYWALLFYPTIDFSKRFFFQILHSSNFRSTNFRTNEEVWWWHYMFLWKKIKESKGYTRISPF
jgi:hypothetical protein